MYDTTSQSYFARSQQAPRGPHEEAEPGAIDGQNGGTLHISDWKYGKQWVYSITYDEALQELHRFAVPIHDEFGIPGHMEAVAGHIGVVRQLGQSSYNGYHHMSGPEMREMLARGWGVGNHSWSHEVIKPDMVDREIGEAKKVLEDALGAPIKLYCAPGDNTNMAEHVLQACRKYGYSGAMSLTDALNRPTQELFWLNRTALHEQFYGPFFSEYDPYRNIRHAQAQKSWIIDYCHCPLEKAIHPNKDCSAAHLRERFETVISEGGDRVWCANPDEVIDYHITRRHTRIETLREDEQEQSYRLSLADLPVTVTDPALTLEIEVPAGWCQRPTVLVDDIPYLAELARPRLLRVTVPVRDGIEVKVRAPQLE